MFALPLGSRTSLAELAASLADLPGLCWLDGEARHPEGRYSFLGADPVERVEAGLETREPLACLDRLEQRVLALRAIATTDGLPPSEVPCFVGYVAYAAHLPGVPRRLTRPAGRPVLSFARYDAMVAVDHREHVASIVGDDRAACERLRSRLLRGPRVIRPARTGVLRATAPERHAAAIEAALAHIAAGDIYQVNLARCFSAELEGDPLALFLDLREAGPVPLGMYYDDGRRVVMARTMERFLRWQRDGRTLVSRPIKGTIARRGDRDREEAEALRGDAKERAEHSMIVDLMRNDLGRVAEVGSVRVPEVMAVEPYAGLSHLVSSVSCRTRTGVSLRQLLEATFPPGSVTGTPKLRAMQIIEQLESEPRDVYTGTVGFIDRAGGASLAVAIRTAIAEPGSVRYFAGGGIVEASNIEREIAETELKAKVFRDVLTAPSAAR
ncbi:MAG: anthranilate synthase component I family protein [Polyangiales bacterium]